MKTAPKKTPAKKTSAKKTAPKKVALKKAALKKKIATKRSAKVGERMAKKDPVKGKKMTISKSSEERAARAARRSLAKEAPAGKEPLSKRARLDSSSDLINLLTTAAPVLDIFAASGSRPLPEKVLRKGAIKDVSYELDNLLEASPASASVLDIIAASASQTFPNGTFVEDAEAGGSEIVGYQLDGLVGSLRGSGPGSASVLHIATAAGSSPLPNEAALKVALEDNFEEALVEEEDAFKDVPSEVDQLLGASPLCASVRHLLDTSTTWTLAEETQDQATSAGFKDVDLDASASLRSRKAYLSPALIWLEEEGLPTAEKEAQDKAVQGEMDKEAVMRRAMGKWKRMSVEEKAVWRKRAVEFAKTNQKK